MASEQPGTGVAPGQQSEESPTTQRQDALTVWVVDTSSAKGGAAESPYSVQLFQDADEQAAQMSGPTFGSPLDAAPKVYDTTVVDAASLVELVNGIVRKGRAQR